MMPCFESTDGVNGGGWMSVSAVGVGFQKMAAFNARVYNHEEPLKTLKQKPHTTDEEKPCVNRVCEDFGKVFVGQTGSRSIERFKEHLPKSYTSQTGFSHRLMLYNHNYTDFHTDLSFFTIAKKKAYTNAV